MCELVNTDLKQASRIRNEEEISKGNRIVVIHPGGEEEVTCLPNMRIIHSGNNSLIKIWEGFKVEKVNLYIGEGGYVEIGKYFRVRFSLSIDARARNTTVKMGYYVNIGKGEILAGDEDGLEIIIGDDFLTSLNLYIRNSDGHTIYETNELKPINIPKFGVHIGNHVWCGYDVAILKDADIPSNCVIGTGAVVGKGVWQENSILAGVPAKMVRTGVNWDKRSITQFMGDKNGRKL